MISAFGVEHGGISKVLGYSGYIAAGRGIAGVGREAAKRIKTPKATKLKLHEEMGRKAKAADTAAKGRGSAGIDIHSRPKRGAGRAAWDRGWNG